METKRKKLGLVLGGGGARGLAHVGVIKVLLKHNIPIDFLAGTSVGAWVSAHYALYQNCEKLEELTVGRQREKLSILLNPAIKGGLVKGEKVKKLLSSWLGDQTFADAQIPFAVVATDLIKGEAVVLREGEIVPAVYASMAVPGVAKPLYTDDAILVDGGVCNPVPSSVVREMGADVVLAVNLNTYFSNHLNGKKKLSIFQVTHSSYRIMLKQLARYSLVDADIVLEPKTQAKDFLGLKKYFWDKAGLEIMKSGEEAAEEAIEEIKALLS